MVTFDCSASHHDGVTLVTVHLRDIDCPTRVTVRNCLDGPVWPPRREGLPAAGWTETGFTGVLAPGSHALGYATPARPADTPAELAAAVAVPETDPVGERSDSPADVVRELGDPSPPGDAVPAAPAGRSPHSPAETGRAADDGPRPTPADDAEPEPPVPATDGAAVTGTDTDRCEPDVTPPDTGPRLPPALGPWMAEMARRVDRAEALAAAETVPEATEAVRAAGGLAEVRALAEAGDERTLRLVARRARRLADRRAGATIPVETLATLA